MKQVLEQALDALEQCGFDDTCRNYDKESAAENEQLKAAQQEPVAMHLMPEDERERQEFDKSVAINGGDVKEAISNCLRIWSKTSPQSGSYAKMCAIMSNEVAKLYTSPPQRKPLTDEEIAEIRLALRKTCCPEGLVKFARAIEAAHNIKE